jgi:fructan beta-fructosidase
VADFTDESYAGGSIGFMTYQSKVTYTNCRIRILENTKSLTAMKLTGATLKQTFSSEKTYYQASAAATAVSFRLSLEATEGTTIHVNGQKYAEGASYATLNLSYGENRYEIVTTTSDGKQDQTILLVNRALTAEEVYSDTYRPYFHYTSASGWENDPNGLIYNEKTGEYHLYYQYPPHDIGFNASAMTWGHAVSTDLVHWVQQGVAIDTDRLGCIWSGSCVVDEENSSGLFDDSTDPKERLVAIYTYYNQKQAIAYSPDGGYTWKKYEGNPVLSCDTYGYDFRDPKVQWIEDADQPNGGLWLMIVAGGRAQIYTSPDLIHWTFNSALTYLDGSPVYSECPDLYCLPVDGNPNNRKWVYVGGGSFYIIGDLKKVKGMYQFVATSQRNDCYNGGSDVYATTSFYNDPKGRRVSMSWIQDYSASSYEDKNWNGAMTVPYETTLRTVDGQIILCSYPVEELSTLYGETVWEGSDLSVGSSNVLPEITEKIYRMELSLDLGDSTSLTIRIRKSAKNRFLLRYDRQKQLLTLTTDVGSYSAPLKEQNGKIDLTLLVDASILEVFGNSGEAAICARYYPIESSSEQTTELTCSGGNAKILWGKVQKMKSSWLTIDN